MIKDVVLCTECKYAHLTTDEDCEWCDMWREECDVFGNLYLPKDFYCAFGERKGDNDGSSM